MGCRSCICCIFCFVIVAASPFVILITLGSVGLDPRFYVQQIYIPALNNSIKSTNLNTSIFMDLKFKRVVAFVPLRYKDLNITLYYGSNRSFSVGYYVVPGFNQGTKKTVHRRAVVEAHGLPWDDALQKVSNGSTVVFAVELAARYMLKRCSNEGHCYYTKPKTVVVETDVGVDDSGEEVSNEAIRLH